MSPEHQARAVGVLDGVFGLKSVKIDTKRSQVDVSKTDAEVEEVVTSCN